MSSVPRRISVIDSHTGGEPTRVVVAGGPDLGTGPLADRRGLFRDRVDGVRSAGVHEPPRGGGVVGGPLARAPHARRFAGVIFFNNVGYLGMCGHGTIGVAVTLARLGRITAGSHRLDTPVGIVGFEFDGRNRVTVENVPSYRLRQDVAVGVPG